MPSFSHASRTKLATCHPDLQLLFNTVVRHYDCTIITGHRGKVKQDAAYAAGLSKLKYPLSKHNKKPSRAVDVAPWIKGKLSFNHSQCYHFVGYVLATARVLGISIRCGADWNMDKDVTDQNFNDLVHVELKGQ